MEESHSFFCVSFFLKAEKTRVKTGLRSVYCRITWNGDVDFSLKKKVHESVWETSQGKNVAGSPKARELKLHLDRVKARITNFYDALLLTGKPFNAEMLKMKFFGLDTGQHSLVELFEFHEKNGGLSKGSLKNYTTTFRYVKKFLKHKHREDLLLTELDYSFILETNSFMKSNNLDASRPLHNNGLMKHMERLRKLGAFAKDLKWVKENPFEAYKLHFDETEPDFLTEDELMAIESLKLNNSTLQLIRDIFVFSCYVGPHYGDAIKIKRTDIVKSFDGELWLNIQREKNSLPVKVPLLPQAIKIIERYWEDIRSIEQETLFPYVSNRTINEKLKVIGELCGFTAFLHFKKARHTFGTTVTLCNNVPLETVSKMMGHKKLATTQIYARVIEKKVSSDMKELKEKMKQKQAGKHLEVKQKG